ncbi:acyl-CoA dehydrogenase family protein [Acrocarpospora catenulata]|uniref:acyl-CoA dehydrogenase family protein n=1 Tax=Acrocarpospora catenulata TaxID=2836182 RepID=UPI001BDABCCB|nr:acyl-CoA dehydrogenase family protein [Acrocarpospora catenulata]
MSLPEPGTDLAHEVRSWCRSKDAAGWRDRMSAAAPAERAGLQQAWLLQLAEQGYAVPHWPAAWGGGRSRADQLTIARELIRAGAPRLDMHFVALYHAAATLVTAGSDEQRATYLPAIRDGQRWCQGFSEPGAGSDLASLRTRAERRGDHYVVNGHKTWSSSAEFAEMCLLLARTGGQGRAGISYFLLDLSSPGVSVRPIRNASGHDEFCDVFLTDVEIPVTARVGAENEGWRIANATLGEERGLTMLERSEEMVAGLRYLTLAAAALPPEERGAALETLGAFAERVESFRLLVSRVLDASVDGTDTAAASILKLVYSELLQDISREGLAMAGLSGHEGRHGWSGTWQTGHWFDDYLRSWEWTIGGGTNDILRNVVGERILGLPRGGSR